MRVCRIVAVLFASALVGGCHLILGLDEYRLACPPEADSPCAPCDDDADCPPQEPCRKWECFTGSCMPIDIPMNTRCSGGVCDGEPHSRCVQCLESSHCASGEYCANNECARCDNGIQDGDESEPDCGGHCEPCLRPLGFPCSTADQCESGFCTDGTCCDSTCKDVCAYCGFGECMYVPQYLQDNDPPCEGEFVCNGLGSCALRPGKPCFSEADCASLKCENGVCTGP